MNNCIFTGRFASQPRRQDSGNTSKCYFTLMVNKEGKKADGSKYPAQAVDFVAWGNIAELILKYKDKGHFVLINSEFSTYSRLPVRMDNSQVTDARPYEKSVFTVKSIEFLSNGSSGNTSSSNGGNANFNNKNTSNVPAFNDTDFALDGDYSNVGNDFGGVDDPFDIGSM